MAWNNSFRKALNDSRIPGHTWSGLIQWVEDGRQPGPYLVAIIENDLRTAVTIADERNFINLPELVRFLINHAPEGAFFNPQALRNWPLYVSARNRQAREILADITRSL